MPPDHGYPVPLATFWLSERETSQMADMNLGIGKIERLLLIQAPPLIHSTGTASSLDIRLAQGDEKDE